MNKNINSIEKPFKIESYRDEVLNTASIDMEWIPYRGKYLHSKTQIFAAAFCTNWGERIVLHISQYQKTNESINSEKALIEDILFYFNQFPLTFGWYTTGVAIGKYDPRKKVFQVKGRDSDFFILHQRCLFHRIESPFEIGYNGKYITLKKGSKNKHIDLIKVFEKQVIKDYVLDGRYRTTSLDSVSSAILEISKYEGMDAGTTNILQKSTKLQKKYVKRDAELIMMLAQYRNCIVLRLMKIFSHYAKMDYYVVCHTSVSNWYSNKYEKMIERGDCTLSYTPYYSLEKKEIGGGHHTRSQRGLFVNTLVYELDAKGMYPTIVINNNLSFDTLNCICCKNTPSAYLDTETIKVINDNLMEQKIDRQVSNYWTCRKRKGALCMILEEVLTDREKYLRLIKEEKSKPCPNNLLLEEFHNCQMGAKLFANSGFGLFANKYFKFSNYKVAECITGEGRRIHKQMETLASREPFNFDIVFGFTDSIFFKIKEANCQNPEQTINQFIKQCKDKLGITLEIKNVFKNSIFYGINNRFVGVLDKENDRIIIKGLDGLAESNPLWIKKWVYEIIKQIITKPDSRFEIIPKLLDDAVFDLVNNACSSKNSIAEELSYSQKLRMHPTEYVSSNRTGKVGRLMNKDKGEVIQWYETKNIDKETSENYSTSAPDPENVNLDHYIDRLFEKLKRTLEITGFDVQEIKPEISRKILTMINSKSLS
ncbi:DNA polymerase I [Candidatus Nitrosocosmicus oleophilus]|uniref:DNA-directed DNA polymerase n=1 Tax=Candidatus Nitrosocosmicus oleophilus TaxID=1353260 RepID=A0A654LYL2_9ARCH|nr:DNA polymerase domain-containing protein [Candidatus Nitrosocosmicus oleophilus]ALI35433.1 DNA polymerase I [Candidatus Nitrosocosmicus oleophilus]